VGHPRANDLTACLLALLLAPSLVVAQPTRARAAIQRLDPAPAHTADRQLVEVPRSGSEFWIPFGSVFVPGLGQYLHGASWTGVGHSGVALAGYLLSAAGDPTLELPRRSEDQLAYEGLHLAFTAGTLSAWDAFHRAMPALHRVGKYDFLRPEEDLGDLIWAPLDLRFLGRWTTLVDLAFTAAVTTWVLEEGAPDGPYRPFHGHDGAFATSLSLNAAVGEEAAFRGWLLPMLTQKLGGRFWLANLLQGGLFGLGHPQAGPFAVVIGAGAVYNGWLTRRNDWSIREGIFQHFWYDVAVVTAALLRDDRRVVTLLPMTIRF
jgi:membrane protease YdiL (CAAX protease family)